MAASTVQARPYQNYETSLAIQCFAAANADGRYKNLLANAEKFIKSIQSTGNPADENYGGSGYDPKKKRADLSNTSFLLDALQATGTGPDDEAVKRALVFVSRCQNLETEHNTTTFAAKVGDGGFYYTPAAGGVERGQEHPRRRPAQLRLDDLRRAEEHDLRRREGR